jgi:hypothetical protein
VRTRTALAAALLAALATVATGRPDEPEVRIKGSNDNAKLYDKAPGDGFVASQKRWEKLTKDWGIKGAPKVDFEKNILVVGFTRGSKLKVSVEVDGTNLKLNAISTRDLVPGFRYEIVSVPRAGLKTVNGIPITKE